MFWVRSQQHVAADEPTIAVAETDPRLWVRMRRHPAANEPRTRRTGRLAATLGIAATIVLAGCTIIPFDFTDPRGADVVTVSSSSGQWRDAVTGEVIWTSPEPLATAVPGNYDGLGRWEPASYWDGHWYTAGDRGTIDLPEPTDPFPSNAAFVMPVPADYDGDGQTEPGYYVGDTGVWVIEGLYPFVLGRATDAPGTPFSGTPNVFQDVPVPADYDGDGREDPAVYRIETGEIHVWQQVPIETGVPYGFPTSANFNDGPGDEAAVMPVRRRRLVRRGRGPRRRRVRHRQPGTRRRRLRRRRLRRHRRARGHGWEPGDAVVIDGGARIVPLGDGWLRPVSLRPAEHDQLPRPDLRLADLRLGVQRPRAWLPVTAAATSPR